MTTEARAVMDAAISERDFADTVVQRAKQLGWRVFRVWNSQHSPAGYPDLSMVRGERFVLAELKTMKGKVSPEQLAWIEDLNRTPVEIYLWRPCDWGEVERVLA